MSKLTENKVFLFLLRACVALLLICLVFNLCVIPSFATVDYVVLAPSEYICFSVTFSKGSPYYYAVKNNSDYNCFLFVYNDGSSTGPGVLCRDVSALSSIQGQRDTSYISEASFSPTYNYSSYNSYSDTYDLYFCWTYGFPRGFISSDIPFFDDLDSAMAAADSVIDRISTGTIQAIPFTDTLSDGLIGYTENDLPTYFYLPSSSRSVACGIYFENNGVTKFRACSLDYNTEVYYSSNGGPVSSAQLTNSFTSSGYTIYCHDFDLYGSVNPDIITYDSATSYIADVYEFLSSLTPPTPPADLVTSSSYFGVPSGYAAYIELPQNSSDWNVQVTQEFDEYSSLFGGQWDVMTSLWGFQSSLPSGNGNFSKTGLTVIPMYKQKPFTVLGQSKTGFSNKATMIANGFWSDTPSNTYLVIYNPVIRSVSGSVGGASNANNVYHYNKGISVTMEGFYSPVKFYKLESTVTTSGVESAPSNGTFEDSESTETFNTDGTTNGVVDSSGNNVNLEDGGGDLIPSATSIGDYLRNLNATVTDFANNFVELLSAPISHVRQLISAGTEYFGVIRGLYAWLPSSVQSTIESALIVSISIGVIGLLL